MMSGEIVWMSGGKVGLGFLITRLVHLMPPPRRHSSREENTVIPELTYAAFLQCLEFGDGNLKME